MSEQITGKRDSVSAIGSSEEINRYAKLRNCKKVIERPSSLVHLNLDIVGENFQECKREIRTWLQAPKIKEKTSPRVGKEYQADIPS